MGQRGSGAGGTHSGMLPVSPLAERSSDVRDDAPVRSGMLPLRAQPCRLRASSPGSDPRTLQARGDHVA